MDTNKEKKHIMKIDVIRNYYQAPAKNGIGIALITKKRCIAQKGKPKKVKWVKVCQLPPGDQKGVCFPRK